MTEDEARFALCQTEMLDHRNAAIRLADALTDINNIHGEEFAINSIIKDVDDVISLYKGLEQE